MGVGDLRTIWWWGGAEARELPQPQLSKLEGERGRAQVLDKAIAEGNLGASRVGALPSSLTT